MAPEEGDIAFERDDMEQLGDITLIPDQLVVIPVGTGLQEPLPEVESFFETHEAPIQLVFMLFLSIDDPELPVKLIRDPKPAVKGQLKRSNYSFADKVLPVVERFVEFDQLVITC